MSTVVPKPSALANGRSANTATAPRANLVRGDIWFVTDDPANPAVGTELWPNRPGLIVSNNVSNKHSGFVVVVYLTTAAKRSSPTHVDLGTVVRSEVTSMALCEQVHTVDISRLSSRCGNLDPVTMREVDHALHIALGLNDEKSAHTMYKRWESYIKLYGLDVAGEINALVSRNDDERVLRLSSALESMTQQRDALQTLYTALLQERATPPEN